MCTKSNDKVYAVEENMYWECSNVACTSIGMFKMLRAPLLEMFKMLRAPPLEMFKMLHAPPLAIFKCCHNVSAFLVSPPKKPPGRLLE